MKRLRRQPTRTEKKIYDVAAPGCKLTLLHVGRVRIGFPQLLALAGWQLYARATQSHNSVLALFCPLNHQGCTSGRVQREIMQSDCYR
uniref:Uncharacterized protein n=1 Tax=Drosophila melanogaster TaxID=7227 RepID=M9PBB0_DROME|nr:uncharacterized protein Dmel_CG43925 [Drosophila melanogaster]AGB92968.1 uncharacterized protein Dmel_CG43925 [Drosophila melanogaster]|eukprot:NP_001260433.1 uncharacterized protein Dmel_CG43925 [Drosophila melanogaster]